MAHTGGLKINSLYSLAPRARARAPLGMRKALKNWKINWAEIASYTFFFKCFCRQVINLFFSLFFKKAINDFFVYNNAQPFVYN